MGLGKTRSAIGAACMYMEDWPVLVICPSTARYHWQHELLVLLSPAIITPKDVTVVDSSAHPIYRNNKNEFYKFYIISYNLMVPLLTHLLTYSLTYSLAYSLTGLLTGLLTHWLTHSLAYSLTHSLTQSLTLTYSLTLTHSLTHSL